MSKTRIILGSDHAGYTLKEKVKSHLKDLGLEVKDEGCNSEESCDYPDFCGPAARRVALEGVVGLVFGGSGQGEAIVANKVKGIRAAVINCENLDLVALAKTHNNANVLSFGARFVSEDFACKAVELWLNETFEGGRHQRRINKIE